MTERSLRTTAARARSGALLGIAAAFLVSSVAFAAPTSYDRAAWIADFEALRDTMTRGYANLDDRSQIVVDTTAKERA